MSEENNSQEFKSVSPTTTEANYKAFNGLDKKKKSNGAGFGKVVILPFYVVYLVQQLHLVHV